MIIEGIPHANDSVAARASLYGYTSIFIMMR